MARMMSRYPVQDPRGSQISRTQQSEFSHSLLKKQVVLKVSSFFQLTASYVYVADACLILEQPTIDFNFCTRYLCLFTFMYSFAKLALQQPF
jgi:hypothetical protein